MLSLINSFTCVCQKRHNNILNVLPCFDRMWSAAKQGITLSLRHLQTTCAEDNKSLKSWEMHTCAVVVQTDNIAHGFSYAKYMYLARERRHFGKLIVICK